MLHPVGNKLLFVLYYIFCYTSTCLNLFIVHFEAYFCHFSCTRDKKN